jgi:hypothetical protein
MYKIKNLIFWKFKFLIHNLYNTENTKKNSPTWELQLNNHWIYSIFFEMKSLFLPNFHNEVGFYIQVSNPKINWWYNELNYPQHHGWSESLRSLKCFIGKQGLISYVHSLANVTNSILRPLTSQEFGVGCVGHLPQPTKKKSNFL